MDIALFGGSFDPPHVGHLLAAAYVLATEPIDELWMVPVFEHPFGKRFRGPYQHRVELCEAALASLGLARAKVSRLEAELAARGGEGRTVELLEHLHQTRPQDRFSLVIGSDLLGETAQWKRFDRVRELARLIVLERGGHQQGQGSQGRAGEGGPVIIEVSSTLVRGLLAEGKDASRYVARPVLEGIERSGYYRGERGG
jgi:nicotinate-nucleotide adenylyltransferase